MGWARRRGSVQGAAVDAGLAVPCLGVLQYCVGCTAAAVGARGLPTFAHIVRRFFPEISVERGEHSVCSLWATAGHVSVLFPPHAFSFAAVLDCASWRMLNLYGRVCCNGLKSRESPTADAQLDIESTTERRGRP